jgi:hypothetical protein
MIQTAEGRPAGPVVVCDHCGRTISRAGEGNYRWKIPPAGEGPPKLAYFTHKVCDLEFEKAHPEPPWGVADLEGLPLLLADCLAVEWEAAAVAGLLSPVG